MEVTRDNLGISEKPFHAPGVQLVTPDKASDLVNGKALVPNVHTPNRIRVIASGFVVGPTTPSVF